MQPSSSTPTYTVQISSLFNYSVYVIFAWENQVKEDQVKKPVEEDCHELMSKVSHPRQTIR